MEKMEPAELIYRDDRVEAALVPAGREEAAAELEKTDPANHRRQSAALGDIVYLLKRRFRSAGAIRRSSFAGREHTIAVLNTPVRPEVIRRDGAGALVLHTTESVMLVNLWSTTQAVYRLPLATLPVRVEAVGEYVFIATAEQLVVYTLPPRRFRFLVMLLLWGYYRGWLPAGAVLRKKFSNRTAGQRRLNPAQTYAKPFWRLFWIKYGLLIYFGMLGVVFAVYLHTARQVTASLAFQPYVRNVVENRLRGTFRTDGRQLFITLRNPGDAAAQTLLLPPDRFIALTPQAIVALPPPVDAVQTVEIGPGRTISFVCPLTEKIPEDTEKLLLDFEHQVIALTAEW